jgi:hypothetical protein
VRRRRERPRPSLLAGRASIRAVVLVALALAGAASASTEPAPIAQGTVTAFAGGSGTGVVAQLGAATPNGVLVETVEPAGAGTEPCQTPGGSAWWYDPTSSAAGASYEFGAGTGGSNEPAFASGTTYSLALPPAPPFTFSGQLPAGAQGCSQSIAFVVPTPASYRLQFSSSGGPLTFNVTPTQLAGQGARPIAITGTIGITEQLAAGVWSISFSGASSAPISWSISGAVPPPSLDDAANSASVGFPGAAASFRFDANEAGTLAAVVLEAGASVDSLLSAQPVEPGAQTVVWDGKLADGSPAPNGTYDVRVTETNAAGETATLDFSYRVDDGSPTAAEARAVHAALHSGCGRVAASLPSTPGPCGEWTFTFASVRMDILDRSYALVTGLRARPPGRPPSAATQVLLRRTGRSFLVVEAFTRASQLCAHPPVAAATLAALELCS